MKCKICGKMATRSSGGRNVYCEKHYWSSGADGSSISEQVARKYPNNQFWNGHGYTPIN